MAITQNDLEILKSEVMNDTDEGGGLPTAEAVVDGVSNNLFPDVSDIDRLIGRVRLRKTFLAVNTPDTSLLQAPRMLITELPDNDNISVFFFDATEFADRRTDAQDKIESYLAFGTKYAGHLLETQLAGQKVIQLSLDVTDTVPSVDDPLVLVQNEGQSDEYYQYIRPTKVETTKRFFQKSDNSSVERVVATVEFGDSLQYNFTGLTVPEFYSNIATTRRAILREARVADAAKYYSASRLAAPVTAMQSRQVMIDSIYTQVVPSTQVETPLLQLDPVGQKATMSSTDSTITINQVVTVNANTAVNLASGVTPGTLSLTVGGVSLTDRDGQLVDSSSKAYAAITYGTGQVTWYGELSLGQTTITGSYKPATELTRVAQTDYQIVGGNAGYNYVRQLGAEPSAGSLTVSYVVQGSNYIVHDDGRGNLVDDDGQGRGSVSGQTVLLTTAAIPDVGSYIIYSFGVDLETSKVAAKTLDPAYHVIDVPDGMSSSMTITWGSGKTASVAKGVITGDATGKQVGKKLFIAPNTTVAKSSEFTLSYDKPLADSTLTYSGVQSSSDTFNFSFNGAFNNAQIVATFNDSQGPIVRVVFAPSDTALEVMSVTKLGENSSLPNNAADSVFKIIMNSSTVSKSTGAITASFTIQNTYTVTEVYSIPRGAGASPVIKTKVKTTTLTFNVTSIVIDAIATTDGLTEEITSSHAVSKLYVTLAQNVLESVVSGSVFVNALGAQLNDKSGIVYNSGTAVGDIDYSSGVITLDTWQSGVDNTVSLLSMMVSGDPVPLSNIVFRTPVAPLKAQELQMTVTLSDGTDLTLSTDDQGAITGSTLAHGAVDFESGVIELYFYRKIPIADNPDVVDEDWYDAEYVYSEGSVNYVNEPIYIKTDTLRYNAIAYSYLPLDSSLIGLDPVRLPTDGRVPFVRSGDSIAITELKTMELPTNEPNDSFDLDYERLSDVAVIDSEGEKVDSEYIDVDLDAGTLAFNGTFDISLYTAPFTAKYRIMDIALVIEASVSGAVTLSTVITHDYTTNAVFSSMLLANDMQARAYNVFSQKSWTSVFSDTLIGDAATSQLQVTANPIVVTNRDSLEERWALVFTSSTSFRIIGETVGEIGTGTTSTLTSPINPMTGYPYFTIPVAAWGIGWSANNVVRFNTESAKHPVWIGNAIQQHQGSSSDNYDFTIGYHANIDRERGES